MDLAQNNLAADLTMKAFFQSSYDFRPMPKPKPGDWLSQHHEPGQTFEEFVSSQPNRLEGTWRKLYLQPVDHFLAGENPSLKLLGEFMQAFFCMESETLSVLHQSKQSFTTRANPYTRKEQILTGDVLATLRGHLPQDAFCLLGIATRDLYPSPSWNFVFGQASHSKRVGVFSFVRYDPVFYGEVRGQDYDDLLLRRACKVLAHETCHMVGMHHCIDYACLMNGSNHLTESDARPLHLCPVCLRKLHHSIGFDPVDRYQQLHGFYQRVGFKDAAIWLENRLQTISR
jgi:archaemetzincin